MCMHLFKHACTYRQIYAHCTYTVLVSKVHFAYAYLKTVVLSCAWIPELLSSLKGPLFNLPNETKGRQCYSDRREKMKLGLACIGKPYPSFPQGGFLWLGSNPPTRGTHALDSHSWVYIKIKRL